MPKGGHCPGIRLELRSQEPQGKMACYLMLVWGFALDLIFSMQLLTGSFLLPPKATVISAFSYSSGCVVFLFIAERTIKDTGFLKRHAATYFRWLFVPEPPPLSCKHYKNSIQLLQDSPSIIQHVRPRPYLNCSKNKY